MKRKDEKEPKLILPPNILFSASVTKFKESFALSCNGNIKADLMSQTESLVTLYRVNLSKFQNKQRERSEEER